MNQNQYQSPYKRMWLDEAMKPSLLQELNRTACSEKKLIMLYFQRYLNLAQSDQLEQLTLHPGLKLDDYDLIQQEFHNTSISQLKATGIATCCELLFYHILLRKRRLFYDYFNGGRFRLFKKLSGCIILFYTNAVMFRYQYIKLLPHELEQKGLFKKYFIEYKHVN